jgi:8-oxo-dGTP pyrophosphatase MutT (NUDIX family)
MIIFLNDRPVRITHAKDFNLLESSHYDHILDLRLSKFRALHFTGHVLLLNVTPAIAAQAIDLLDQHPEDLLSVTLVCNNKKEVISKVKSLFKVMKAAGGVVLKEGEWLMIYRRKKWDLPKGKLDRGEKSRKAAVREIKEETGVKAIIKEKLCTTWHTYTYQNNRILKRTKWYVLDCLDDSKMTPQVEEDIERLEWLSYPEVQKTLIKSFSSIRYVVECLHKIETE